MGLLACESYISLVDTRSLLFTNVVVMMIFQCSFREILWMVPVQRRGARLILFLISLIALFITGALPKVLVSNFTETATQNVPHLGKRKLYLVGCQVTYAIKAHRFVT